MRTLVKTRHKISDEEINRQEYEWRIHEYKRAYSDWTRAFYRWFERANAFETLKRERALRQPEELSDEQRQADILKFENDPLIRRARK
jgi:hypothetical protein